MTSEQFCFWMRGFVKLNEEHLQSNLPTLSQWNMIKEHLDTVFDKVTPKIKTQFNPGNIVVDLSKVKPIQDTKHPFYVDSGNYTLGVNSFPCHVYVENSFPTCIENSFPKWTGRPIGTPFSDQYN